MFNFENVLLTVALICGIIIVSVILFCVLDYNLGTDIELEYMVLEKHYITSDNTIITFSNSPISYMLIVKGPLNKFREDFSIKQFSVDLTTYAKAEVNKNIMITKKVGKYSKSVLIW